MPTPNTTSSSSASANLTPAGLADIEGLLAGLKGSQQNADVHARHQTALLAFGRRTSARPDLSVLMQDAVALVTEILEADLGGLSEVVGRSDLLVLKLFSLSAEGRVVEQAAGQSALDPTISMAGYALDTASPVVSYPLANDKRFSDMFLRELGVVSALTVPLPVDDKPFGTIGVYSKKQREFTLDDVRFAETIAHLLTSSVARSKAEERLYQQQTLAATVLESVDELVLVVDVEGNLLSINRAARQITGFSSEELRGRSFWSTLVAPQEIDVFQAVFRGTVDSQSAQQFESFLLGKDNKLQRVGWTLKAVTDAGGRTASIVLTGSEPSKPTGSPAESKDRKRRPAGPLGTRSPENLRSSPRRTFEYRQLIAPMYGGVMPSKNKFIEVVCKDLSGGGISFYLDRAPDFQTLLVALGRPPDVTYFTARVVRVADEWDEERHLYLVGCQFSGRAHV